MQISQSDWLRYIRKLSAIDQRAADAMQSWMDANAGASVDEMIYAASLFAERYGEASASLACEMYDAIALAQGAAVPPAEAAQTATFQETARAVRGTLKNQRNTVPQTVGRLVKQAGADTMLGNAARDGAQFAWVPMGDTCSFCVMLASRGWQRQSKRGAASHAEHIHANCDCTYAVRFDGKSTVQGYDPDKYLQQYENAEGDTWQAKLNSMRRENYAANRERINEQKRVAYANREKKTSTDVIPRISKNVELPESLRKAQNIPEDIKQGISDAIDKIKEQYNVQMDEIEFAPFSENTKAPFSFIPYEQKGKYRAKLNVNSVFDWNESLDSFNDRVYNKNYRKGILASKDLKDLVKHEAAHFMTFQDCQTWTDFLLKESKLRHRYIPGISRYNESLMDGAESIAEGFVRISNGETVDESVQNLVDEIIGRYSK